MIFALRLSQDLARFEADLKEKAMNARGGSSSTDGETTNKKEKRKISAADSKKQKVIKNDLPCSSPLLANWVYYHLTPREA